MKRLPGYDHTTSRGESLAFLGLALMALPLIGSAVWEAGRFSQEREAIISALTHPASVMVAGEPGGTNVAMQASPAAPAHQPLMFKPADSPRS